MLAGRLYGDLAIRVDLERRGIDAVDVDTAIATLAPELARATTLSSRSASAAKLSHMLRRKGYTEGTIESVVDGALRFGGAQG